MGRKAKIRAGILPRKNKRTPRPSEGELARSRTDGGGISSIEFDRERGALVRSPVPPAPSPTGILPDFGAHLESIGHLEPFRLVIVRRLPVILVRRHGFCVIFRMVAGLTLRVGEKRMFPAPLVKSEGVIFLGTYCHRKALDRSRELHQTGLLVRIAPEKGYDTESFPGRPEIRIVPLVLANALDRETDG